MFIFVKVILTASIGLVFVTATAFIAVLMGLRMLFFLLAVAATYFILKAFAEGWKELERH